MRKIKNLIFEQVSPPQYQQDQQRGDFATQVPADNSLDMKVDRYLVRYEREAIPTQSVYEGVQFERDRMRKLAGLLMEQEDPPADEEAPEDAPADDAGADAGGLDFDLGGGGDPHDHFIDAFKHLRVAHFKLHIHLRGFLFKKNGRCVGQFQGGIFEVDALELKDRSVGVGGCFAGGGIGGGLGRVGHGYVL